MTANIVNFVKLFMSFVISVMFLLPLQSMKSPSLAIITIPDFYQREYKYGSLTLHKSVINDFVESAAPLQEGVSAEAKRNYYEQQKKDRFLADLENTAQRYGKIYTLPDNYSGSLEIGFDVFLHQNAISNLLFYTYSQDELGIHIPVNFENIIAFGNGDNWQTCHSYIFLQPISLESTLLEVHGFDYEKYKVIVDSENYKKDDVLHILPTRIGVDIFFERTIFYGYEKYIIGKYETA